MASSIRTLMQQLGARRVAWRRQRNLAAAAPRARLPGPIHMQLRGWPTLPAPAPAVWIGLAGLLGASLGAVLIVRHAQALTAVARQLAAPALGQRLPQFGKVLAGATVELPASGGIALRDIGGTRVLLAAAGSHAGPALRIDLCRQLADAGGRLVPLRIGYSFEQLAGWVGKGAAPGLRAVVLATPAAAMPKLQLSGNALDPAAPLTLRWEQAPATTAWLGDSGASDPGAGAQQVGRGQARLLREGWLLWQGDSALHLQRQRGGGCAAGQLLLQLLHSGGQHAGGNPRGLLAAFAPQGAPLSAWLAPGSYQVPAAAPAPADIADTTATTTIAAAAGLEDQALFEQLRARGMLRLGANGLAELVPRDLAAWRALPEAARAGRLAGWDQVMLDEGGRKLLKHLYRMADGAYVRDQLRIFNSERRLLAWRLAAPSPAGSWQASVGSARAGIATAMPPAAARLFAAVGQDWQPWRRIEGWQAAGGQGEGEGAGALLRLELARPAAAGQRLSLMVIGHVASVDGAQIRQCQAVCDGRACPARDAAELLSLELQAGARSVSLRAAPLDMAVLALPGDQQYRHLRIADGRLDWLALPAASAAPLLRAPSSSAAVAAPALALEDRAGRPLWVDGAPSQAAIAAGLAPLLGLHAGHASSVSGMLARLPGPLAAHRARLSLDLPLQALAQRALDCIGLQQGRLQAGGCSGGRAPPAGRHAGLVILDAETGEILAAAGAGGAAVTAANWNEVRNFDRSDPARSPLRLPALQHDGGANASPGSTFKLISALGLELAARQDGQLDALLGGMPLAAIDRLARQRGFAFDSGAASYPAASRLAHVTNYQSQPASRRAVAGQLGLAQALSYSINTWFAWTGELSDRSLFGRADGGVPDLQALDAGALDGVRPIVDMAGRLGFGQALRLDGGLLPADYPWGAWDALQASAAHIDPIHSRHELRQMAIGLRMQVTPLQMALAAAAVGQGAVVAPRLLLALNQQTAAPTPLLPLGVRLDRIRAGMKGVIDFGTAAGAFRDPRLAPLRAGLFGKTGTAPTGDGDQATVWFTGYLEPGRLPGQAHRLAMAAFVSHSAGSGGEHAAPIVAAVLAAAAAPAHK